MLCVVCASFPFELSSKEERKRKKSNRPNEMGWKPKAINLFIYLNDWENVNHSCVADKYCICIPYPNIWPSMFSNDFNAARILRITVTVWTTQPFFRFLLLAEVCTGRRAHQITFGKNYTCAFSHSLSLSLIIALCHSCLVQIDCKYDILYCCLHCICLQ